MRTVIDEERLRECLARWWGLARPCVQPHHGGMNSATWLVAQDGRRWVVKAALRTHHGYDDAALADLARAAVDAAFAPATVREWLHRDLDAWLDVTPPP